MKTVSVIMPAFNTEKFLAESVESVLAQTFTDFELLIVDDGSIDRTAEIAHEFESKDPRVKLILQKNQGVSVARNTGIENSTGQFIAFLDSDDLWKPDFLESLIALTDSDAGIFYSRYEISIGGESPHRAPSGYLEKFIDDPLQELSYPFHIGSLLIRCDVLDRFKIRFKSGMKICEDVLFITQLLSVSSAIGIDKTLMIYRIREKSATTSNWNPEEWIDRVQMFEYAMPFVNQHRPEALEIFKVAFSYQAFYFSWNCLRHGYIDFTFQSVERWKDEMKSLSNLKFSERIKCDLLLTRKRSLFQLVANFHKSRRSNE